MIMRHLLWVLSFLLFLIHPSTSSPVNVTTRESHPFPLKDPSNLEQLHERYKGFWFEFAADTCTDEEFDTLIKTVSGTMGLLKENETNPRHTTPGWNRFFMADYNVPRGKGWASFYNEEYKNIIYAFDLVGKFPLVGSPKKGKGQGPGRRIILTCKPLEVRPSADGNTSKTHCEKRPQVAAYAMQRNHTPDKYASVVTLCPLFFRDQNMKGVPSSPKTLRSLTAKRRSEIDLPLLATKEAVLAHELFHCEQSMKMGFLIDDVRSTLPTVYKSSTSNELEPKLIYGPEYCTMYAWKNTHTLSKSQWRLNPEVRFNADSYTWFLTFNWFNEVYNWKSDGSFSWPDLKTELKLKRNPAGSESIANYVFEHESQWETNFESNPATVINATSLDETQSPSRPNCYHVGGKPLEVKCELFGWYQPSPVTPTTTPSTPAQPTVPAGVPAPRNPLYQIIIGFRVAYAYYTMTPINYWAWWTPDVGKASMFCDGPVCKWAAKSGISLNDVPYPPIHSFDIDVNGFSACSYTGSADSPGTFSCAGWESPIQCTNGVHATLHGENHGCPPPLGDPHENRPKVVCQWGNPPPAPPKPSPSSQVVIGFKTWGSNYDGTDVSPSHKYWEAWTPDIGKTPEFCHSPVATWDAPMDISIDAVPYPRSHVFEVDLNGVSGCSYQGDSDKPGTLSCLGWSSSVQCTNGVHSTLHKCAGDLALGGGWKKMRSEGDMSVVSVSFDMGLTRVSISIGVVNLFLTW